MSAAYHAPRVVLESEELPVSTPDRVERALSTGDIWLNDWEPLAGRATTALIERHGQPHASPDSRAHHLADLHGPPAHWCTSGSTPA